MGRQFLKTLGAIKSIRVVDNVIIVSFYGVVDITMLCSCLVSFEKDGEWSEKEEINSIIDKEARKASETFSSARFRLRSTRELHLVLPEGEHTRLEICDKEMKDKRIFSII